MVDYQDCIRDFSFVFCCEGFPRWLIFLLGDTGPGQGLEVIRRTLLSGDRLFEYEVCVLSSFGLKYRLTVIHIAVIIEYSKKHYSNRKVNLSPFSI